MPNRASRNVILWIFVAKIENRKSSKSVNPLTFSFNPDLHGDDVFSIIMIASDFLNQIKTFFL